MDVLRKELDAFYDSQNLSAESLDYSILACRRRQVETSVEVEEDCRVITDANRDVCYIYGGRFASLIGLGTGEGYADELMSSDEDVIYNRIHPEDLVDKRMLEYEFFKYADTLPTARKLSCRATCRIRIKGRDGAYVAVDNSTRVLQLSPQGKVWLILCCYDLSPEQQYSGSINARIMDSETGKISELQFSERRGRLLTAREKEILRLIKEGKLSKEIADILGISVHTVSRHRQNILQKLSVGNSVEAIMAASLMRLL